MFGAGGLFSRSLNIFRGTFPLSSREEQTVEESLDLSPDEQLPLGADGLGPRFQMEVHFCALQCVCGCVQRDTALDGCVLTVCGEVDVVRAGGCQRQTRQ